MIKNNSLCLHLGVCFQLKENSSYKYRPWYVQNTPVEERMSNIIWIAQIDFQERKGHTIMWEGNREDIETVGEGESDLSTFSEILKEVKNKKTFKIKNYKYLINCEKYNSIGNVNKRLALLVITSRISKPIQHFAKGVDTLGSSNPLLKLSMWFGKTILLFI